MLGSAYALVSAAHLWGFEGNERLATRSKNHVPPEAKRKQAPSVLWKATQMLVPRKLRKELQFNIFIRI